MFESMKFYVYFPTLDWKKYFWKEYVTTYSYKCKIEDISKVRNDNNDVHFPMLQECPVTWEKCVKEFKPENTLRWKYDYPWII